MDTKALAAAVTFGAGLGFATPAGGAVEVEFVDPQRYADIGAYGSAAARNLSVLERHLTSLAGACVTEDEHLRLRVLDVDLAGYQEWWHSQASYNLRVMRSVTWPRIHVEYELRDAAGTLLDRGRERVSDLGYLRRSFYVRHHTEALPYERAMLREWIGRRFCDRLPRRSS